MIRVRLGEYGAAAPGRCAAAEDLRALDELVQTALLLAQQLRAKRARDGPPGAAQQPAPDDQDAPGPDPGHPRDVPQPP